LNASYLPPGFYGMKDVERKTETETEGKKAICLCCGYMLYFNGICDDVMQ